MVTTNTCKGDKGINVDQADGFLPSKNNPDIDGLWRDLVTLKDCMQSVAHSLEERAFDDEIPDLSQVYSEVCSISLLASFQGQKLEELLPWLERMEYESDRASRSVAQAKVLQSPDLAVAQRLAFQQASLARSMSLQLERGDNEGISDAELIAEALAANAVELGNLLDSVNLSRA